MIAFREATLEDLATITNIQTYVYDEDLVESAAIFASIITCSMSVVAIDTESDQIIGFLLAHPTKKDYVHLLHHNPPHITLPCTTIFLHDMSIMPAYHKKNIGRSMYHYFQSKFHMYEKQLVSVNNSYGFWQKLGFQQKDVAFTELHYDNYASRDIVFMESTFVNK